MTEIVICEHLWCANILRAKNNETCIGLILQPNNVALKSDFIAVVETIETTRRLLVYSTSVDVLYEMNSLARYNNLYALVFEVLAKVRGVYLYRWHYHNKWLV